MKSYQLNSGITFVSFYRLHMFLDDSLDRGGMYQSMKDKSSRFSHFNAILV